MWWYNAIIGDVWGKIIALQCPCWKLLWYWKVIIRTKVLLLEQNGRDICQMDKIALEQKAHCFETNILWQERTQALEHYLHLRNGLVACQLHILIIRKPNTNWTFITRPNPCVHIWGLGSAPRQPCPSLGSPHLEHASVPVQFSGTRPSVNTTERICTSKSIFLDFIPLTVVGKK